MRNAITVMPADSSSQNGVASLAYAGGLYQRHDCMDCRIKSGNDDLLIQRLDMRLLGELHGRGEIVFDELAECVDAHRLRLDT